jgi:uncharacterized membrane protein YdbT with pleckstrin-like domain
MRQVFGGAALVSAGIAGFIEAHTAPMSRADHDLLRVAAWTLVIFGAVVIILSLIRYLAAQTQGLIRYWAAQTQKMEEELEHRKRMEALKREKRRERPPSQRPEQQTVREPRPRAPSHAG